MLDPTTILMNAGIEVTALTIGKIVRLRQAIADAATANVQWAAAQVYALDPEGPGSGQGHLDRCLGQKQSADLNVRLCLGELLAVVTPEDWTELKNVLLAGLRWELTGGNDNG